MSDVVLKVEGLTKKYTIGENRERYVALRDVLARKVRRSVKKLGAIRGNGSRESTLPANEIYALKDVSFEVRQGEVVGIIGRNGAGKSTLLKILSRITEPTEGRVRIRGRVASLLEVGTGFHPELTGRENIYLNGAVLGMRQAEIDAKFDEIVAFAEVEQFLDTPVKRYSSGMQVRLAFAVAAHLQPEILIVDEVLAVGDAEFQKKCLTKMSSVAESEGRTVLFVSHNMDAVMRLCTRVGLLERGRLSTIGGVAETINAYVNKMDEASCAADLKTMRRPMQLRERASLVSACLKTHAAGAARRLAFGDDLCLEVEIEVVGPMEGLKLAIALMSSRGFEVASCSSVQTLATRIKKSGRYRIMAGYSGLRLAPGVYRFGLGVRSDRGLEDYLPEALEIEIVPSSLSAALGTDSFLGAVVPEVVFEVTAVNALQDTVSRGVK